MFKEIIMLGSAHMPFDSLPGKFIMQLQELCADMERGWKHIDGHVKEDRLFCQRGRGKMTQTFTFQGQPDIKSAQQACKTISLISTRVYCEIKNEKLPFHFPLLAWSQQQLYQHIQRDGNYTFRSRNYLNQVCH